MTGSKSYSLKWRLILVLSAFVTIAWGIGAAISVRTLSGTVHQINDDAMKQQAELLLSVFTHDLYSDTQHDDDGEDDDDHDDDPEKSNRFQILKGRDSGISIPRGLSSNDDVHYILINQMGELLYRSKGADLADFPDPTHTGFFTNGQSRYYFLPEDKGRIAIYFREDLNVRKRVIWNAFARLAAPLLIVLPILFAVISWIVSAAMRPIDRLGHALGERGEGNLDPITAQSDVPAEIDRMQRSVNQLLERLRKTVSVERRFISQAAHELRTPVAAAMAQNERMLGVLSTANEIEKAQNVHSSLVRLKRLCERLLEHAKAEGGVGAAQRKMDMRDIVGLVVREFETRDAQGRIEVDVPDTPVMQSIDPDGYAIILRNLFDNALVHGDADGLVRVTLSDRGVLNVQNDGPTIPFDKCRAIESGSNPLEPSLNGNGMGLHIVRKIADAMSMTVSVTSPVTQDGGGARFTIAPKD